MSGMPGYHHMVLADADLNPVKSIRQHVALANSKRKRETRKPRSPLVSAATRGLAMKQWTRAVPPGKRPGEIARVNEKCAKAKGRPDDSDLKLPIPKLFLSRQGGDPDPFSAYPIKIDAHNQFLINFGLENLISTTHCGEILATGQSIKNHVIYGPLYQHIHHVMISDETLFLTFLAISASRLTNLSTSAPYHERIADAYMYKAVRSMRRRLGRVQMDQMFDVSIFRAITDLAIAEWLRGSLAAAQAHMRISKILSGRLDLSDRSVSPLFDRLYYYDAFISAETTTVPLFSETSWYPSSIPDEHLAEMRSMVQTQQRQAVQYNWLHHNSDITSKKLTHEFNDLRLTTEKYLVSRKQNSKQFGSCMPTQSPLPSKPSHPSALQALGEAALFSGAICRLIHDDLDPWRTVAVYCFSQKPAPVSDGRWMCQKGIAILHQLLCLGDRTIILPPTWTSVLEEAFRITVIIAVAQVCSPTSWRTIIANRKRLHSAIATMETRTSTLSSTSSSPSSSSSADSSPVDENWQRQQFPQRYRPFGSTLMEAQLALWILVVGLAASDESKDCKWFISRASTLAVQMAVVSREDIEQVIARYFHVPCRHLEDLERRIACG